MPDSTLNEYFGLSVKGSWDDILGELKGGGFLSELKSKAVEIIKPELWPKFAAGIGDDIGELFNVKLGQDLLANAWRKYSELTEYADPEKHPPEETNLVPLGKHTLKIEYSPYLEILLQGQPLGKMIFDVKLALELEGFVLTIRDGKILKVRTGDCRGSGTVEYADKKILQRKLTKVNLPGAIDLGEGISLRHGDDAD